MANNRLIGKFLFGEAGGGITENTIEVIGVTQGGYEDGDTIPAGTDIEYIIRDMLQVQIPPTYTSPSLSLVGSGTKNVEAGTVLSPTLTPNWTQNDAGSANDYDLDKEGVEVFSNGTPIAHSPSSFTIGDENIDFQCSVSYDQGPIKNDNFGDPYPTGRINAGTINSNTVVYRGYRNLFYASDTGTAAPSASATVRGLESSSLNPSNGTSFTINIEAGTTRVVFAYPATLQDVSTVKYVELGNGEVKDTFTQTTVTVEGANGYSGVSYKVYTYTPAIPFGDTATYNVTI